MVQFLLSKTPKDRKALQEFDPNSGATPGASGIGAALGALSGKHFRGKGPFVEGTC